VCVHQVGPDQEGFLDFYARQILPALGGRNGRGPARAARGRAARRNGNGGARRNGHRRPAVRRRAKARA
jgi:hypothetical protein